MILFTENGHLTDEALRATVNETLDEMARLEVAEHLSFCDGCLERYTALLTDDTLRTPATPITAPVLSRLRRRAVGILFNKYTTYAAAACLAMMLWGAGMFQSVATQPPGWQKVMMEAPSASITTRADSLLATLNGKVSEALRTLLPKPSYVKESSTVKE